MKKRKYIKHQIRERIATAQVDALYDYITKSGMSITDFAESRGVAGATVYRILNHESVYWTKSAKKIFEGVINDEEPTAQSERAPDSQQG